MHVLVAEGEVADIGVVEGFVPATASSPARSALDDRDDTDRRKTIPRFTGENFQRNVRIADEVEAIAAEVSATPAQIALGLLPPKAITSAPIRGTTRADGVGENVLADRVTLTAEQVAQLDNISPAAGDHHNEAQMAMLSADPGTWLRHRTLERHPMVVAHNKYAALTACATSASRLTRSQSDHESHDEHCRNSEHGSKNHGGDSGRT